MEMESLVQEMDKEKALLTGEISLLREEQLPSLYDRQYAAMMRGKDLALVAVEARCKHARYETTFRYNHAWRQV